MALRSIIFDFFGTLVAYRREDRGDKGRKAHSYLTSLGYRVDYERFISLYDEIFDRQEREARLSCREFHIIETFRLLFKALGLVNVPPAVRDRVVQLFVEDWNRSIDYYEGIGPFIRELSKEYRLSIISNIHYPPLINYHLREMGIADYFALVVTSAELGIRKPDPRIFYYALDKLHSKGRNSLYIGDSYLDDYPGAIEAGLKCCIIDKAGELKGSLESRLDSLFDLTNYLRRE